MARDKMIEICAINIAANPHPKGIYISLLTAASKRIVLARGSDFAKITAPRKIYGTENYSGRILIWTDINMKGRWLNLDEEEALSNSARDTIFIPDNAKPNYRTFNYVFIEENHRIYFESKSDLNESLGPTTALRIFERLLVHWKKPANSPDVSVTLVPKEGTVRRILSLPGLRSLEISLLLPNADLVDGNKRDKLHARLRAMKAKRLDEKLYKQAGKPRLEPDQETKDLAEVASENGYVKGEGRRDGQKIELSTRDEPRRERASMESGNSFFERLVASIGLF